MITRPILRLFDLVAAILGGLVSIPLLLIVGLIIRWTSSGPALFRQVRLGRHEKPFVCLKLRTMRTGTRSAGTHEISASAVTGVGRFLRRSKIDELPQLWNVLVGDMSLVGPRPGLPTQTEMAHERRIRGVFRVRPGITGPGQISGLDMSTPAALAEIDATYASRPTVILYFRYVLATALGKGQGDRVRE